MFTSILAFSIVINISECCDMFMIKNKNIYIFPCTFELTKRNEILLVSKVSF